jgi:hypothetical protein
MTACEQLSSSIEVAQCKLDCAHEIERPVFEQAVAACVASGQSADRATCTFKSPLEDPILTEAICTMRCREEIADQ